VRPFVKRQKNDAVDAEAIVIAARQPEMRFVEPKTVEQQSRAAIFRGRERVVHQRTADANALRALLYEHGHVFPTGIRHLNRTTALVEDVASDLPALLREECQDLLAQIAEKTARITEAHRKTHGAGLPVGQGASAPDHAGRWTADGRRGGSVRPRHGAVQNRT
jgi:transposase